MFIFILVVIIIAVIAFIAINSSKQHTNNYSTPTNPEQSSIYNRRPKISAEVDEGFYNSVQEYCQKNSITISALIRKAVESYIVSDSPSSGITFSKTTSSKSSTKSGEFWKCPSCGKLNAHYVGTCACGGTKDAHPKPVPKRPSYVRKDGSWKCPKCGTVNAAYVGTCSCGRTKGL